MTSTSSTNASTKASTTNVPHFRPIRTGPVETSRTFWLVIKIIILLIGAAFSLYPLLIIISSSFSASNSISGQSLIPTVISFDNYNKLFNDPKVPIGRWMLNSIIISSTATVLSTALTTLAAFAFSRFRYAGRQMTLLFALVIQVFPAVVALSAIYLLLQQIGKFAPSFGLSSWGGLILIYCGGSLGASAFLMKGYFDTIPKEIDESAHVDGATHWITFTQILFPLIRPILAVNALLAFIGTFNDYLLPRVLLVDNDSKTLAAGLTTFLNGQFGTAWGVFAAGALFTTIPIIIVFLILQTQIVSGLSAGAVKG